MLHKILKKLFASQLFWKIFLKLDKHNISILHFRHVFGCLTIVGDNKTYKIETTRHALQDEIDNRNLINSNYRYLNEIIIPIEIKYFFNLRYLTSKTMQPLTRSEYLSAFEFLTNRFRQHPVPNNETNRIEALRYIYWSIDYYGRNDTEKKYLKELAYETAKMQEFFLSSHGDFHIGNILNDSKKYLLIDIDCFRRSQFAWIDELYYVTELIMQEPKKEFNDNLSLICRFIANKTTIFKNYSDYYHHFNLNKPYIYILLYSLDRIGQDFKYGITYKSDRVHFLMDESIKKSSQ